MSSGSTPAEASGASAAGRAPAAASAGPAPAPACRVPGCTAVLSAGYHSKYRICVEHSQAPQLQIGQDQTVRFCQQCGRFHELSEFDEGRRSCRYSLNRHKERRRLKAEERHSVQRKRRGVTGAACKQPADAAKPGRDKGRQQGTQPAAAAEPAQGRRRPAGVAAAAVAAQPAQAERSQQKKRPRLEAAADVDGAASAKAARLAAVPPAQPAATVSTSWSEPSPGPALQPTTDATAALFPPPAPAQQQAAVPQAVPAAQELQQQASLQPAAQWEEHAGGCTAVQTLLPEPEQLLTSGGGLELPVPPTPVGVPRAQLVREALSILQAPEDPGLETLPSEEEMLTISLELGLDLRLAAPTPPVAGTPPAVADSIATPPPLPLLVPQQLMHKPWQPQTLQLSQQWQQPGMQLQQPLAEAWGVQGSLWAACQPSPAACDTPPAPLTSPFASSSSTSWGISSGWGSPSAELLCATPVHLAPLHAPAGLPSQGAQLPLHVLLGVPCSVWPAPPTLGSALQGAGTWGAAALPCVAALGG
ncbi:hypothetical protein ABPG75_008933 [Micractinium tetrahymenae]